MSKGPKRVCPGFDWRALVMAAAFFSVWPAGADSSRFDAASVKPCEPDAAETGRRGGGIGVTPGKLHIHCVSLGFMIQAAYVMSEGRLFGTVDLTGGPRWVSTDRFDIEAEATGTPSGQAMQGPMLRDLLAERFGLKLHREAKEAVVYEMMVGAGGFKLQPLADGSCMPMDLTKAPDLTKPISDYFKGVCGTKRIGRGTSPGQWMIQLDGMTLDQIAENLRSVVDRPVVNKTGISGLFNLRVDFAPDETVKAGLRGDGTIGPALAFPDDPPGGVSIFGALQQIGLKLQPGRGPYGETLVIDAVQKPSEN